MSTTQQTSRTGNTVGYYTSFVGLGLAMAALGPTLPGLAAHTGTTLGQISVLFMAQQGGYLAGTFAGGRLYDRVPGHPVLVGVLLTMALMLALAPVMSHLATLCVVLAVLGLAVGVLDVGGNTLLVWTHGRGVAPFMNGLHFCFGVGALLSPIIIESVAARTGDIVWPYWALAILIVPSAVWLLRLPSPPAETSDDHDARGDGDVLTIALIAVFFFTFVGAELGFGGWINTYAMALGNSQTTGRHLTAVFWGALTLGRLLVIPVAARVSPRAILAGNLVGCLAGLGVLAVWPGSSTAIWVGTFAFGFAMAPMFPTGLNLAERLMTITGKVTGWFLIGGSAGSMCVPWLIGQFFESVGPAVMVIVLLGDMVLCAVLFALLQANARRHCAPAA